MTESETRTAIVAALKSPGSYSRPAVSPEQTALKVCSRCGKEKLRLSSGQDYCRKCKNE